MNSIRYNDVLVWLQGPRLTLVTRVVNIALVLWLASTLAQLTWRLTWKPELPVESPQDVAPVAATGNTTGILIRQVAGWHLFGQPAPEVVAAAPPPEEAPDTSLKIVLRGVLASNEPREARAIIADPRGNEEYYALGDELPGGAKLHDILADRVILLRNKRYETLRLPREDSVIGSTPARLPATPSRRGAATDRGAVLQEYRQALKDNPRSLIGLVRPQPVKEAGQFIGFELRPGRDRDILDKLGLEPGDVITRVNDVALDSPIKGMQALKSLTSGDNVSVTVRRGGQDLSLSFNVPN
jgi:general secretion pathway protein C